MLRCDRLEALDRGGEHLDSLLLASLGGLQHSGLSVGSAPTAACLRL